MDKTQTGEQLINKYLEGNCTPEEKNLVEQFYLDQFKQGLMPDHPVLKEDIKSLMWSDIAQATIQKNKKRVISIWPRIAAAVLVTIGVGFWFYTNNHQHNKREKELVSSGRTDDIVPGKNVATLRLSNGKVIQLSDTKSGIVIASSELKYNDGSDIPDAESLRFDQDESNVKMLTVATPRGGQYRLVLPDGTKVWLNAASVLTFPASFGGKQRKVELSGEGYFEVAKNKEKPFLINSGDQSIEVLGTHFNVNTYADEPSIRTTLLEGAVKVISPSDHVIISPGQQAVLKRNERKFMVQDAHLEEVMAWKSGYFQFNGESIQAVMRKVSRWYNVDITYLPNTSKQGFVGTISRFENVTKVLKMLELTGTVHFKIEGRRILVMP